MSPVRPGALVSEEDYVAREVAVTKALMDAGTLSGKDRLARSRAYARRRYRGYLSGEVAWL